MMSMSMSRNQQQQGEFVKPVDYFRPLSVDVSVEYELPKEFAPPKGSAPLLIVHPSANLYSASTQLRLVSRNNPGNLTNNVQTKKLLNAHGYLPCTRIACMNCPAHMYSF